MQKVILLSVVIWTVTGGHVAVAQQRPPAGDSASKEIIALERAALQRWINLDPQGYLDLYLPDLTYFDPRTDKRLDGREAMIAYVAPMKNMKVPFTDRRYEMIDPKVQFFGDVALLTFNVVNYGKLPGQPEGALSRWNSTEIYRRVEGKWRIIHSHWSFTKPEVKQPGP